jgi:hypothetical protein
MQPHLLPPNENVVTVREFRVLGVWHRVEGTDGRGEFVDDVVILAVIFSHDFA